MDDASEIAKAIQSTAKFGEKSLESVDKLGSFFAKVFKEPISEVSGMISDRLRFVRWKRLVKISEDVNDILMQRGISETKSVPPKLALPIFEESSLEDDQELNKLWVNLLANAMDPNFNSELRYGFIDMIKNITGIEVKILNEFYGILQREGKTRNLDQITHYYLNKDQIMHMVGIDETTYQVNIYNSMRMQLIAPALIKTQGVTIGGEQHSTFKGTDSVVLTPLGVKFIEACIK